MSPRAKSLLMGLTVGVLLGICVTYQSLHAPNPLRAQYPQAAIDVVTRATNMLNDHGNEAFAMFDRDARFNHPDSYLFVLAAEGTNIYHAADSSQVGENFAVLRDVDLRPFGLQLVTDADPEGVWSAYRWNNPVTGKAEWKLTFTRQSQQGHIGAVGIYAGSE